MKNKINLAKIISPLFGLVVILLTTFFVGTTLVVAAFDPPTLAPPTGNPPGFVESTDPVTINNLKVNSGGYIELNLEQITAWDEICNIIWGVACGAVGGGDSLWTDQVTYIEANNATSVTITDTGDVSIGAGDLTVSDTVKIGPAAHIMETLIVSGFPSVGDFVASFFGTNGSSWDQTTDSAVFLAGDDTSGLNGGGSSDPCYV